MIKSIRRRTRQIAKKFLLARGYKVLEVPPILIQRSDAELRVDLEFVIHDYLSRVAPSDFFFIQIGSFDGVTNDPIRQFIERYRWRGILVEPQKQAFQKLRENYSNHSQLIFLNRAVADKDGTRDFYHVRNEGKLPFWSEQIASLKFETILKHRYGVPDYGIMEGIPNIENLIEVERVDCITLDTLFRTSGAESVDLLQIDAEGFDYEIIRTIDFRRMTPAIIHYEHMHLSKREQNECIEYLMDHGYRVATEFENTIAYLR